jgi:hypothetical protein
VKYRKVQELVESQVLTVEWITTTEQVADIFTKQMPKTQFEHLRNMLQVFPREV